MKLHTLKTTRDTLRPADGHIIENTLDPSTLSYDATGRGTRGELDHSHTRWMNEAMPTIPDERPDIEREPVIANHAHSQGGSIIEPEPAMYDACGNPINEETK